MSQVKFLASCSACAARTEGFETEEALAAHMLEVGWKRYRPRYVLWTFCGACVRAAGEVIEKAMVQDGLQSPSDFSSEVARITAIQELVRGRTA